MNKLIKGAVTGAAGIALLLGGAGTFAAWNSQATVLAGNSVNTGSLKVQAVAGTGSWKSLSNPTATVDPATYAVVPGETLEYQQQVTLTASGPAMTATLGFTNPTFTNNGATDANFTAQTKIISALPSGVSLNSDGTSYTIKPSAATASGATLTVALDITFNGAATNDQQAAINLSDTTLNVTQTYPAGK